MWWDNAQSCAYWHTTYRHTYSGIYWSTHSGLNGFDDVNGFDVFEGVKGFDVFKGVKGFDDVNGFDVFEGVKGFDDVNELCQPRFQSAVFYLVVFFLK